MRSLIIFLLTGSMATVAQAELVKSTAEGFIVGHTATIESDVATAVDGVLAEQLGRLARAMESK